MQYEKTDTKFPKFLMNSKFIKGWKELNKKDELDREIQAKIAGVDFDEKNWERE